MSVTWGPLPEPAGCGPNASRACDRAGARAHYAALLAQCGSSERPELSEARTFVAQAR